MIIAFRGRQGTGKSSMAHAAAQMLGIPTVHSFSMVIKRGAARYFGFEEALCYTQNGKKEYLPNHGMTVREALCAYGAILRKQDPLGIVHGIDARLHEWFQKHPALPFLVDDIRMPEELAWARKYPSLVIQAQANEDFHENGNDITETALDDDRDYDLVLQIPRLKADGSFSSLEPAASLIRQAYTYKMANWCIDRNMIDALVESHFDPGWMELTRMVSDACLFRKD